VAEESLLLIKRRNAPDAEAASMADIAIPDDQSAAGERAA